MKRKVKMLCSSIIFVLLLCIVLSLLGRVMERKYSYTKYYDFYHQKEDFDVLFFGTSHMLNGVYPMELWNDYGIVSYNMANNSETICTNYWQLKYALKYTKPKVVVVDLYAVDGGSKANLKYLHNLTDTIPLSWIKFRMVTDLLPKEEWAEYLFEFSLYHSRWEDLSGEDFQPPVGVEKGAELRADVTVNEAPEVIPKEQYSPEERVNKDYLQKMIDLCKEEDIQIVLTYLPYSEPAGHQEVANWGYVIAQKNDIPYLNFLYEDFALNYATDCADLGSHVNASGARKITDYIGKFIVEQYDMPDRKTDERYSFWEKDYEEYTELKINELNRQEDVRSYLLLLYDRNLEIKISAPENALVYQDSETAELLRNIETLGNLTYETIEGYEGNFHVEVKNRLTGEIVSDKKFTRIEENVYETY